MREGSYQRPAPVTDASATVPPVNEPPGDRGHGSEGVEPPSDAEPEAPPETGAPEPVPESTSDAEPGSPPESAAAEPAPEPESAVTPRRRSRYLPAVIDAVVPGL